MIRSYAAQLRFHYIGDIDLSMRIQLTTDNGLRTQVFFIMFSFTRFYLRVLADLNKIIQQRKRNAILTTPMV